MMNDIPKPPDGYDSWIEYMMDTSDFDYQAACLMDEMQDDGVHSHFGDSAPTNGEIRQYIEAELAELRRDHEVVGRLRAALAEAMSVRHYCCMEGNPDSKVGQDNLPYTYDKYLIRWAEACGCRVYSNWPKPGGYREEIAKAMAATGSTAG